MREPIWGKKPKGENHPLGLNQSLICLLSPPGKKKMKIPGVVQRWSSKPKEHTVARVRDNQRRHRAKTKAYIAELERRLAEEQARVEEILVEKAALLCELESLRARGTDNYVSKPIHTTAAGSLSSIAPAHNRAASSSYALAPLSWDTEESPVSSLLRPVGASALHSSGSRIGLPCEAQPARDENKQASAEGQQLPDGEDPSGTRRSGVKDGGCSCTQASPSSTSSNGEDGLAVLLSDCSTLPPPARGESTIPCTTAYNMIKQQNYRGWDLRAIGEFLTPGFRGPTITGDGCRVDSNRVFSAIDSVCSL